MLASMLGASLVGVDARPIEIEVELAQGLPVFTVIGLGDRAVQEARYRVQSALRASELVLPHRKITVNLAPADLRKDGAALDLPMALGLLMASEILDPETLSSALAIGELALNGKLRPVRGVLPAASLARRLGLRKLIVPLGNGPEASSVSGPEVLAVDSLAQLVTCLRGQASPPSPPAVLPGPPIDPGFDLSDVRGQLFARRGLEVAAAGEHNLLLVGPPGTGKTMLARRLPTILPGMSPDERIEVSQVWSAAGLLSPGQAMIRQRPFRAPHHSLSPQALVGGGVPVRPGEVSLAHRGVLFLDELPELSRPTLEALRQPLEDLEVTISRARETVRMPAAFMLITAANPCACGWLGDRSGRCRCPPEAVGRYAAKLSGPLLDRIDLILEVPTLAPNEILEGKELESSSSVRSRVIEARARATHRQRAPNARLSGRAIRRHARLTDSGRGLLASAIERFRLSARVIDRTLRVARSIADLSGQERVGEGEIAEALRFRRPPLWEVEAPL